MRASGLEWSIFEFIKTPGSRLPWRDEPLLVYGASKGCLSTAGVSNTEIVDDQERTTSQKIQEVVLGPDNT